jgi:hypothetical protein
MTTDEVIKYLEYADDFMRHNADWHDREAIDLAIEALKGEKSYQKTIYKLTEELKMKDEPVRGKTTICGHTIPEIIRILDEHDYKTQG